MNYFEMAEWNKVGFLLFISSMIFPARALDVILSGAHEDFKQKSAINIEIRDGVKTYCGTLNQLTYEAQDRTEKVIVYIISRSRCVEILKTAARRTRSQIAKYLRENYRELVFLGIEHVDDDEYHLIGEFIFDKIQPHPDQPSIMIETIGENRFDQFYRCNVKIFGKCQEYAQISEGWLLARLRSIPHGALRPVRSNDKAIKLIGYRPFLGEVEWNVRVENGTYVPRVDLSHPTYNFMLEYPDKKICLLILSGKEYSALNERGSRRNQRKPMRKFFDRMQKHNEVLLMLGVFNFDWTEIDIVTQIILTHSQGWPESGYNVFTCGYGMFNTYYRNVYEDDRRDIRQQPKSHVTEVINILMGTEVKERVIKFYYYDDKWDNEKMPINLSNGRYSPAVRFNNFTFSSKLPNQKIAFIVFDKTEINYSIDYIVMVASVLALKGSGISVVLVEARNFGLDDMHIIAEWIDHHSGVIDSERITVLGAGIFDTIFQSESTTYNAFFNTRKNDLEIIRNVYVKSNEKSISVVNMNTLDFKVWSYPMNSVVNGFYELDLIPDKNTFNITDGRRIYFIITNTYHFERISAMENLAPKIESFRRNIGNHYYSTKWSVFLVGLNNFEERDFHLFAELTKRQIIGGPFLGEFFRTLNYGISEARYQYKDTAPFSSDNSEAYMHGRFAHYFGENAQTSTSH